MTTNDTFSTSERVPGSVTALALLANPYSTLLDRGRLAGLAEIAFRPYQPITCHELALLRECARSVRWLRRYTHVVRWLRAKLKWAITFPYAWGVMGAATTQRLIDRYALWSD
jgi:hypothetical protein